VVDDTGVSGNEQPLLRWQRHHPHPEHGFVADINIVLARERQLAVIADAEHREASWLYPIHVYGRTYIVSTDESGGAGGVGGLPAACARGASPFGYPNIIDITNEQNPTIVAKLMLQVSEPANCMKLVNDPPDVGAGAPEYSVERCVANRADNPRMLACTFHNAGLRVFDIRDLFHAREIAYYKPPAPRTAFLPVAGRRASI